jgi:small nuclear ribonucleoprotein (snRNP)-like protein
MTVYKFRAIIEDPGGGGAYVTIPFDVEKAFGKKRVKVKATIDGEPYRGSLVRMGTPDHMLLVLKDIREKIGKTFGDEISIELEEDLEPRKVEIPPDLQQALDANPNEGAYFTSLAYSHRKEYVWWINDAKRDQTRQERIRRTIVMLKQGIREP